LVERAVGWLVAWRYDRTAKRCEAGGIAAARLGLAAYIPPCASVLEIGAGTGSTLAAGTFDARPPDAPRRIVLTEPDSAMRARLERKLRAGLARNVSAAVVVHDFALPKLPVPEREFDAVVICFVASHLARRAEGMKELFRVMKPGGVLAILDHGAHVHDTCTGARQAAATASEDSSSQHHHHRSHGKAISEHNHDSSFTLSWFWEWIRFHSLIRKHKHSHGQLGLDFGPIIDDIKAAGFEQEVLREIKMHDTGFDVLSEILFAIFKKPSASAS
jgi:ubiquinone/menaquinone biosynthesis C-methylase UbiE